MMNHFESWLLAEGLSHQTARMYCYLLHRLIKAAGPLECLSTDRLCQGLAELYAERNTEQGKKLSMIALRKYYRYMQHQGHDIPDPTSGVRVRRHRSRNLPVATFLTAEEINLITNRNERYTALVLRNKIILSLLCENALTSAEIAALRWKDIELPTATLKVKSSLKHNGRRLKLSGIQVYLLGEHLRICTSTGRIAENQPLLCTQEGLAVTPGLITYVVEQFKSLIPGKEINPLRIRQSVIYHWLNTQHIPLEEVQIMAGHRDISSTLLYKAPYSSDELAAINLRHPINDWARHPIFEK
ncbi:MAG: tyrosine-type recombinase/integrase [Flavobacteriales bacterium]